MGKTCGLGRRGGIISCLHHPASQPATQPASRPPIYFFLSGPNFYPNLTPNKPQPKPSPTQPQTNLNPTSSQPQPNLNPTSTQPIVKLECGSANPACFSLFFTASVWSRPPGPWNILSFFSVYCFSQDFGPGVLVCATRGS